VTRNQAGRREGDLNADIFPHQSQRGERRRKRATKKIGNHLLTQHRPLKKNGKRMCEKAIQSQQIGKGAAVAGSETHLSKQIFTPRRRDICLSQGTIRGEPWCVHDMKTDGNVLSKEKEQRRFFFSETQRGHGIDERLREKEKVVRTQKKGTSPTTVRLKGRL